ncbi:MAG: class I SAM-dependent methyltransferase [Nanobdellota archaeon]
MQYYNQIARGYEELHREEQEKKIQLIKKNLPIKNNDKVLDLGSGPGFFNEECEIYRVDPSHELLKKANGKKVQAFAEELPFKDNTFDKIISVTAMQNFSDLEKAATEMKRVCKGKIALSFLKKSQKSKRIENIILKHFSIKKAIEEEKDKIFIVKYKNNKTQEGNNE